MSPPTGEQKTVKTVWRDSSGGATEVDIPVVGVAFTSTGTMTGSGILAEAWLRGEGTLASTDASARILDPEPPKPKPPKPPEPAPGIKRTKRRLDLS